MLNADAHLRLLIGDLIVKIAIVSAENDALKAQLAALPPPSPPDPPPT